MDRQRGQSAINVYVDWWVNWFGAIDHQLTGENWINQRVFAKWSRGPTWGWPTRHALFGSFSTGPDSSVTWAPTDWCSLGGCCKPGAPSESVPLDKVALPWGAFYIYLLSPPSDSLSFSASPLPSSFLSIVSLLPHVRSRRAVPCAVAYLSFLGSLVSDFNLCLFNLIISLHSTAFS